MKANLVFFLSSLVCTASLNAATLFQLDFDDTAGTLAGWESFGALNGTNNFSGYTGLASGDITIATSGTEFLRSDNSVVGSASNAMLNDLHLANNVPGGPYTDHMVVTVSGLAPGTYLLTTYHIIPTTNSINFPEFDFQIEDSNSTGAFDRTVGSYQMGNASTITQVDTSFTITGTDDMRFRLFTTNVTNGGSSNWTGINGMEITIPEPSSSALIGLGVLGIMMRRRR
jgi:hypothetical protein